MLRRLKRLNVFIFALLLIFPATVGAGSYVRPNNFMDKSGAEKVAEIKKFQALSNLTVTGGIDDMTYKVLYGPNMVVKDEITNPPTPGEWIVINKSKKTLTYYKGTSPMYKFPVAIGTSSTPTPSAKGKIMNKHKNPAWGGMNGKYEPKASDDPNNPLGERWMGLNIPGFSGYGIHGTIKPAQIGQSVSNGCIRMFNYDIETFIFPRAKVGMPVWMGTDQELANWGVKQTVVEEAPKPVEKVQEKPVQPKEETYKGAELLEF
ncbi:Lipoprotein-anchoring transpeptidase ErfK/SrfK [Anaerosphaera aminiphila DSM 21120]|uniref:Lipoprotein-anchoring transpeptidase ErfK/SrfK n=1 Tax=Anaerosphaera aminiphila DSM 21120 TaxID=1120995 RepID=A0A1M5QSD7_9FIRM|nr:L,D-transpeptidase family protein [Anaerosphaera aminiphila]SHH16690.1 Lipoprotein-anchoring transpeptidase ErfK/SrfK [Anaerosphaera aminiphila DSM 21120]